MGCLFDGLRWVGGWVEERSLWVGRWVGGWEERLTSMLLMKRVGRAMSFRRGAGLLAC